MFPPNNPLGNQLHKVLDAVMYARNSRDMGSIETLLQKTINGLMELYTNNTTEQDLMSRFRDCHILVLKCLHDPRAYGPAWLKKQVTRALVERSDDHKYNLEALDCLIRSQLVNMQQFDVYLVQLMENGINYMAVAFAMQLIQRYCISDKHNSILTEVCTSICRLTLWLILLCLFLRNFYFSYCMFTCDHEDWMFCRLILPILSMLWMPSPTDLSIRLMGKIILWDSNLNYKHCIWK